MKALHTCVGLSVLIAASAWGSVASAQPTIPKQQIPSDLPAELRQRIEALYSPDAKQRAQAVAELGSNPKQVSAAIPFLMAMLHDDVVLFDQAELTRRSMISSYWRVFSYPNTPGQQAAETLSRIGTRSDRPTLAPMIACLKDPNKVVRANALRAVGETLGHISSEDRNDVTKGLPVVESLIDALKDDDTDVHRYAAIVLQQFEDPRAVEPLIALLEKSKSWEAREAVASALGAMRDPRAAEPLTAVLGNHREPPEVRRSAAEALGKTGDARAIEPLAAALVDDDWRIRRAALSLADLIRDPDVLRPLLIAALHDTHWRVREMAARATTKLASLKDPAALEMLLGALRDDHPNVRANVVTALAELKDPRAVVPLATSLREDENSYVRWHAAEALGKLGDPRAIGALTAALGDDDEIVRNTARRALEEVQRAARSRGT